MNGLLALLRRLHWPKEEKAMPTKAKQPAQRYDYVMVPLDNGRSWMLCPGAVVVPHDSVIGMEPRQIGTLVRELLEVSPRIRAYLQQVSGQPTYADFWNWRLQQAERGEG
jgi:hypothetical protein